MHGCITGSGETCLEVLVADVLGLSDVSSEDTGKGSQLKTGNLKRSYNMPKACVQRKMKQGMSAKAAHKACYPKKGKSPTDVTAAGEKMAGKKGSLKRAVKGMQASIGGAKARRAIKKYEKKSGKLPQPY